MSKITKEELDNITSYLKWNVFRNSHIMFGGGDPETEEGSRYCDLIDMIASLHNLLYEAVTGERYDYMFHWANKIGSDCADDFFDDIMKENQENENQS